MGMSIQLYITSVKGAFSDAVRNEWAARFDWLQPDNRSQMERVMHWRNKALEHQHHLLQMGVSIDEVVALRLESKEVVKSCGNCACLIESNFWCSAGNFETTPDNCACQAWSYYKKEVNA